MYLMIVTVTQYLFSPYEVYAYSKAYTREATNMQEGGV